MSLPIPFDNTYARLPERFFARLNPTPVSAPPSHPSEHSLGGEPGDGSGVAGERGQPRHIQRQQDRGGFGPDRASLCRAPVRRLLAQLGDGRAILLGEVVGRDGMRRDIQLKGSGPTPFSRRGDGRAAVGPVLREYILSEAMAALGVPSDPGSGGCNDRRDGAAGDHGAWRDLHPGRREPYPRWHLPVFCGPGGCGGGAPARRLRHCAALPRGRGQCAAPIAPFWIGS